MLTDRPTDQSAGSIFSFQVPSPQRSLSGISLTYESPVHEEIMTGSLRRPLSSFYRLSTSGCFDVQCFFVVC